MMSLAVYKEIRAARAGPIDAHRKPAICAHPSATLAETGVETDVDHGTMS
jgi:hypothetical protein